MIVRSIPIWFFCAYLTSSTSFVFVSIFWHFC